MQKLSTGATPQTLGELYPSLSGNGEQTDEDVPNAYAEAEIIALYDVVYASIIHQGGSKENN